MKTLASAFLFCLLLAACSVAPGVLTPSTPAFASDTPAPPTFTPLPTEPPSPGVLARLHLSGSASTRPEVDAGSTARLSLRLEPVLLSQLLDASGNKVGTSYQPWQTDSLTKVQLCLDLNGPCQPGGEGQPYQLEIPLNLPVDWLGPRPVWVGVAVLDALGAPVQLFDPGDYHPAPVANLQLTLSSVLNEKTPLAAQPAPILTAAAATRTAFPLTGSVLIENGRCCAGGVAGSTIQLKVAFSAQSSQAQVTEMRISQANGCQKDTAALDAPWEPYVTEKTYKATLALNWIGWYISVQYRDAAGNLSPVYCDDISLEGNPPAPAP